MVREVPAPAALVEMSQAFERSVMGERRRTGRPPTMSDICYRLLDTRRALREGEILNPSEVLAVAEEMELALEHWKSQLQSGWSFAVADAAEDPTGVFYEGKRHVYQNLWMAQVWNNWRTLRLSVSQLVLESERQLRAADSDRSLAALAVIHELSAEICTSAAGFAGSPRQ